MKRIFSAFSVIGVLLYGMGTVHAAPPSPSNPAGRILGVVPVHDQAGHSLGSGGSLTYHGGPVEIGTHHTYAIFWGPSYGFAPEVPPAMEDLLRGLDGSAYLAPTSTCAVPRRRRASAAPSATPPRRHCKSTSAARSAAFSTPTAWSRAPAAADGKTSLHGSIKASRTRAAPGSPRSPACAESRSSSRSAALRRTSR